MTGHRLRTAALLVACLLVIGGGLAAVIGVGRAAYGVAARSLSGDTAAQLADVAAEARAQLDRALVTRLGAVETLAASPAAESLSPALIRPELARTGRRDGGDGMLVLDRRGRLLAGELAAAPGIHVTTAAASTWLRAALARPRLAAAPERTPLAPGRRVGRAVVVSAPIRTDSGRAGGVWVDVVSAETLDGIVASVLATRRLPAVHLYVVDRRQRLVASDLGPARTPPAVTGSTLLPAVVSGQAPTATLPAAVFQVGANGSDIVAGSASFAPGVLSQLGWSVVAAEPRPVALAPADRVSRAGWLIAGVASLVVLLATAAVVRTLRRVRAERARLDDTLRRSQKLEAVGRLAGSIAHDFNNVLTVIGGNAQLALGSAPNPEIESNLREILYSSERASDLVRRLLVFSRPDTRTATTVDLNNAIHSLTRMLPRLIETTIVISTDLDPEPSPVLLDSTQIEQVILNLAINARDAMPAGGTLTIRTRRSGATVRLEVADTGTGMDPATRERIFEPFFTTKPDGEGTGLGLPTVYGIVRQAGGSIDVESAPRTGTTFTIELPLAPDHAAREDEDVAAAAPAGRGERVLVVDDDETVRVVAIEMLSRAGYEGVPAPDGAAAVELLGRGEQFDLVVADIMMPRMTGLEVADDLRARGREVPFLFMSGYDAATTELGVDNRHAIIRKPFTQRDLVAAVRRLLAAGDGARART